ncbi:hypothetical protein CHRYSEOSP005_11000 [Chryseobacterium sp. Alg-005]|uniref:hypothetical protein n=1 Tax=Chryseobacterium sp. Alg-005 TaxID=3159516 RepID=UPI003555767D
MVMKLINTIEINPLKYSKEEYELPEISDYPDTEEWYRKWMEVVSKLNVGFHTLKKDSYLVDINTISEEDLQMILEVHLSDVEQDNIEDTVVSFDGRIVVMQDDEILIQPTCCGFISYIKDWERIFEHQSSGWLDIWIGHPWILCKKENGKVLFSDYTESNISDNENIKVIFEAEESELKIEFEKVKQDQISFKNRITETLKKMYVENAEKISELITGI